METVEFTITLRVSKETLVNAVAAGMIQGPHGHGYWRNNVRQAPARSQCNGDALGRYIAAATNWWSLKTTGSSNIC